MGKKNADVMEKMKTITEVMEHVPRIFKRAEEELRTKGQFKIIQSIQKELLS